MGVKISKESNNCIAVTVSGVLYYKDLTFMYESDPMIGKIAVVAKEKWRDELLMFLGAGRRQAQVKFFCPDEESEARAWLSCPAE